MQIYWTTWNSEQYQLHWTACHFDKYNFSFSQRKTRSVFCFKKNCKLYFHRIAQKLCKPASRAAGGSSLASESCTIRKSWKKIQLPFITCNSANYERHFHNNGQAHTLILNLPFTGKCQRRFDPHDQSNNIHEHSPTEAPQLHLEEPRALDSIYIYRRTSNIK